MYPGRLVPNNQLHSKSWSHWYPSVYLSPPPASLYSSFFHGQNIHVGWGGILLCFIFKGIVSQDFRGHPAIPAVAHLIFYYRKMRYNIEWHMQMKRTKTLGKSRRQPNYIYAIINGFYTVQQINISSKENGGIGEQGYINWPKSIRQHIYICVIRRKTIICGKAIQSTAKWQ